jgi:uncharacterized protein YheU (UPF0270 family)
MTQVIIPWKSLTEAALTGVIEEFVTREGTEYGMREVPVATKVATVRRQLESGTYTNRVVIRFRLSRLMWRGLFDPRVRAIIFAQRGFVPPTAPPKKYSCNTVS